MKRLIALILAAALTVGMPLCASAAQTTENEHVVYYADGSYLVITTTESLSRASVKTACRNYRYYNALDDLEWMAKLSASFRYNGTDVVCTASNLDIYIYYTNWYVVAQNEYRSGATAVGEYTMGRQVMGAPISETAYTITITCDANGNLS